MLRNFEERLFYGIKGQILLGNLPQIEETGAAMDKAMQERNLTIDEALTEYGFSDMEYLVYMILRDWDQSG